ncbi:hypothetical protein EA772_01200 [Pedobacter sp. G11]|uniref:hypothetical protein n=1 Tax=Pedobacter sp. G11 TaxID=2482728 RepID=UPI000F601829|nr:hypothetical protein [Pedobacter sp. G11]AZI24025.1 hypothetical protein EA772_01200 [Pedobacter sp. G11]
MLSKAIGKKAARKIASKVVGRFIGRLVPHAGWVLSVKGVWDHRQEIGEITDQLTKNNKENNNNPMWYVR